MKRIILSLLFGLSFVTTSLSAQMQNHYILGTNGINSAVKPTGVVLAGIYNHYHSHSLKNRSGHSIELLGSNHHLNINCVQTILAYFTDCCFLGGKYGFQVDVPFLSSSRDFVYYQSSFDVNNNMRLSDIYTEPLNLRYSFTQFDLFVAYGFYAPSGKYKPFSLQNSGLGNWGHMFTAAATFYFDCARTITFSMYNTYEIHCKKRGIDFRPGDNYCCDWGFGKTFGRFFTLGIVGYYERQTTVDRGDDVPTFLKSVRDQVWSWGPEFDVVIPELNGQLTLRYQMEFAAKARTQGNNFVAALGFVF